MKKYFLKDDEEDVYDRQRVGEVIYKIIVVALCYFFGVAAIYGQKCTTKIKIDECVILCSGTISISPPIEFEIIDGTIHAKTDPFAEYQITSEFHCAECQGGHVWIQDFTGICCLYDIQSSFTCDGLDTIYTVESSQGDCNIITTYQHSHYRPIPPTFDTVVVCNQGSDIDIVENYLSVNQCDSIVFAHYKNAEDDTTRLIPIMGPVDTTTIIYLTNQYGCDSIIIQVVKEFPKTNLEIGTNIIELENELIEDHIEPTSIHTVGIPNVFTPNGDGINDCLQVFTNGEIRKLIIANSWGEIVHTKDHLHSEECGWDGFYKGEKMTGVFAYSVIVNDKLYKGNFTILN